MKNQTGTDVEPTTLVLFMGVGLVWLALFAIALSGYPNLMDNERRVGAYILDAVQNGHWIVQRDVTGDTESKPPLLTWVAALSTLAFGRINLFSIYLPSALATLGVSWLILGVGRKYFGWVAGLLGALAYLLSPVGDKGVLTARYDGLLALPVALGALAAFRAWNVGRGWTWFWLAAAVATLVKGPLGLILAAGGLMAAFWERRSGKPQAIRGSHWLGIGLYLVISGGWLALAYAQVGQPLIAKMIGRELVAHAVHKGTHMAGEGFYEPTWNAVTQFLPWSIVAAVGFWRVWRQPAMEDELRRFERFLFCWFFVGLILFSVAAHQRARLVFPLMPAAALLAGRELARCLGRLPRPKLLKLAGAVAVLTLAALTAYHHLLLRHSRRVQETLAIQSLADTLRLQVGEQFPLTHLESPFALQIYLNTMRPWASCDETANILSGDAAAYVAVCDFEKLQSALGPNPPHLYELFRWPERGQPTIRLVSNHPSLEWTDHMVTAMGHLSLRMDHARLLRATDQELVFVPNPEAQQLPEVTLSNTGETPLRLRVRFLGGKSDPRWETLLLPGHASRVLEHHPAATNPGHAS